MMSMPSHQEMGSWAPTTDQDKTAILEALNRLLQSSYFHASKRYPSFLRFVVTQALEGNADSLKERTLGIEVFGRDPSYDTTNDPIVRVTAAEIRKRIAQYYQDSGHEDEIRILLPSGSYVPQFCIAGDGKNEPPATVMVSSVPAEPLPAPTAPTEVFRSDLPAHSVTGLLTRRVLAVAAVVASLLSVVVLWQVFHNPAIEQFWQPFLQSDEPVLFCIADQSHFSTISLRDAANPQHQNTLSDQMITVIIDDISPLVHLAGMLQQHGKPYRLLGEATTTLTDLRQGPSVLIGAFDNGWTLRVTAPLRFHFANDPAMTQFWIEDRQNPTSRKWLIDRGVQQERGTYKDYAIVARFVDPNTDKPVVVVAGIGRGGTVAAGEFLADPGHMNDLAHQAPKGWSRKNMEIILETQVIDGRSGPPHVAAVHVW
jgi:hypothetical protein